MPGVTYYHIWFNFQKFHSFLPFLFLLVTFLFRSLSYPFSFHVAFFSYEFAMEWVKQGWRHVCRRWHHNHGQHVGKFLLPHRPNVFLLPEFGWPGQFKIAHNEFLLNFPGISPNLFSQPALWIFPVHFTKLPASKKFWMELESKKDKKQNKTKFHGTFVSMVHTIFIYTLNFIYFIKYYNCNQKIGSTFALLFL